jgi:hypothetical protein
LDLVTEAFSCKFAPVRLPEVRLPRIEVKLTTLVVLIAALVATAPAWIVEHPPLQDLPFHMATLRVIHDHGNAAYGFAETYRLSLLETEYLLYYVVGDILAFVMGVRAATIAMVCVYLAGMPIAMMALLRALGKDERLALFVVPLSYNVMFCFGLLPFVFGFPLMLGALAIAVRHFENPTPRGAIVLGVAAVAVFFAHLLPFALFGVGCIALFPWTRPQKWFLCAAPLVGGLLLVLWWMLGSKAGGSALQYLARDTQPFAPPLQAFAEFPNWSTNIFHDDSDERWAIALGLVALVTMSLSAGDRDYSKPVSRTWFLVPAACSIAYLSLGAQLGDVWMFAQRFAVPALFTCVPLLRMPRGGRGWAVTAGAIYVLMGSTINVCKHFIEHELEDVADFEDAIESMEPRKHVAGLIFDRRSHVMQDIYGSFIHFVSYYQVEKGGVVQFSYTGFPHWPVQYNPGHFPPPGTLPRLRWEWMPDAVPIRELYPYYDYVLVRGNGFNPPPGTYHVSYRGPRWTVFKKD